jgi:hypothetical protein
VCSAAMEPNVWCTVHTHKSRLLPPCLCVETWLGWPDTPPASNVNTCHGGRGVLWVLCAVCAVCCALYVLHVLIGVGGGGIPHLLATAAHTHRRQMLQAQKHMQYNVTRYRNQNRGGVKMNRGGAHQSSWGSSRFAVHPGETEVQLTHEAKQYHTCNPGWSSATTRSGEIRSTLEASISSCFLIFPKPS